MYLLRYIRKNVSQEFEIDIWRNIFKISYFNSVFFIKYIFKLEIILQLRDNLKIIFRLPIDMKETL